jgi:hypothetical protein
VVIAKYLLIRESGQETANRIFRILSNGPKVYTGERLKSSGYESDNLKEFYLVIEIEKFECVDFGGAEFDFKKLEKSQQIKTLNNKYDTAGRPFAVSLKELMATKLR